MENSQTVEKIGDKVLAIIHDSSSPYATECEYLVQYNDEGNWCFPGGSIKLAETPDQAVSRELQEQYGLELEGFRRPILHQNKSLEKQSTRNPVTFFCVCGMKLSDMVDPEFHRVITFQHQKHEQTKLHWSLLKHIEQSVYSREILDSVFSAMYREEEMDWNMTFDEMDQFLKVNPYVWV